MNKKLSVVHELDEITIRKLQLITSFWEDKDLEKFNGHINTSNVIETLINQKFDELKLDLRL